MTSGIKDISERTYELEHDRGDLVRENLRFTACTFDNCSLSLTNDPKHMSRITNVELIDCASKHSRIGPAILDEIIVENLATSDLLIVWGAHLRHVTLKGKLGKVKINASIQDPKKTPEQQQRFDRLREQHYDRIDWALDISDVKPQLLEIEGIPADRIVLNHETQVAVDREHLNDAKQLAAVRDLDDVTRFTLESFIERKLPDIVLVAPTGNGPKKAKPVLDSFAALRRAGLVRPAGR
jgi:hypothetical protein